MVRLWVLSDYLMVTQNLDRQLCRALAQYAARATPICGSVTELFDALPCAKLLPTHHLDCVHKLTQKIDALVMDVDSKLAKEGLDYLPVHDGPASKQFNAMVAQGHHTNESEMSHRHLQLAALWGQVGQVEGAMLLIITVTRFF
jgi:hypothetical protein